MDKFLSSNRARSSIGSSTALLMRGLWVQVPLGALLLIINC